MKDDKYRKMLMNNLVPDIIPDSDQAKKIFSQLGIDSKSRAEQTTIKQFLNLTNLIISHNLV